LSIQVLNLPKYNIFHTLLWQKATATPYGAAVALLNSFNYFVTVKDLTILLFVAVGRTFDPFTVITNLYFPGVV